MNVNIPPEMENQSEDGLVGDRPSSTSGKVNNHLSHKDVFLVMTKNAFIPAKCVHSVNTYSRISTVPRWSERSE